MKIVLALFFSVSLLIFPLGAQQEKYWTRFYIEDKGSTPVLLWSRCTVNLDQAHMDSYLEKIGWPVKKFKPAIDWKEDIPVIISTQTRGACSQIKFKDLKWTGRQFVLEWGWSNPLKIRGSSTMSAGLCIPRDQILIVVVKRYVYTKNELTCHENTDDSVD